MNAENGKASVGQIGCLSVVGLALVFYFLGKASERNTPPSGHPETAAPTPMPEEAFDPMDMIRAKLGPMTLYYASHSARSIPRKDWDIGGYYDLSYPGRIDEDPRLPRSGGPDVDLSCAGGGFQPKTDDPVCYGKHAKHFDRAGQRFCTSLDEIPPADVRGTAAAKGWNGSVGWMGWGECHMTFARGLLGKKISVADAVTYASEAADWMEAFADDRKPDNSKLASNRELLAPARRYAAEHGGRD